MKKRSLYISVLRILGILLVIYAHTSRNGIYFFTTMNPDDSYFYPVTIPSVFAGIAVPIFFSISGALMLHSEKYTYSNVLRQKIPRILIALVLVSALEYIDIQTFASKPLDLQEFFYKLYTNKIHISLWYLYSYLSFLICLPLMARLAKAMSDADWNAMLLICLVFYSLIPLAELVLANQTNLLYNIPPDWILTQSVFYPLLGYWMNEKVDVQKIKRKQWLLLWIANALLILFSTYMIAFRMRRADQPITNAKSMLFINFRFINMIVVFLTVKYLCSFFEGKDTWLTRLIHQIGDAAFGVYLIHVFVYRRLNVSLAPNLFERFANQHLLGVAIYVLMIFVISTAIALVLKKLPLLKHLL